MVIGELPEVGDGGFIPIFRRDGIDPVFRVEGETGGEIGGNGHAGDHPDIEQPVFVKQLPELIEALCPLEAQSVCFLRGGRSGLAQLQHGVRLPPGTTGLAAGG